MSVSVFKTVYQKIMLSYLLYNKSNKPLHCRYKIRLRTCLLAWNGIFRTPFWILSTLWQVLSMIFPLHMIPKVNEKKATFTKPRQYSEGWVWATWSKRSFKYTKDWRIYFAFYYKKKSKFNSLKNWIRFCEMDFRLNNIERRTIYHV